MDTVHVPCHVISMFEDLTKQTVLILTYGPVSYDGLILCCRGMLCTCREALGLLLRREKDPTLDLYLFFLVPDWPRCLLARSVWRNNIPVGSFRN